jgi:hypothetical protein
MPVVDLCICNNPVSDIKMHFLNVTLPLLDKFSDNPMFRVYNYASATPSWTTISYKEFLSDLVLAASYWNTTLTAYGVQPNAVVGVWYVYYHKAYGLAQR